MFSSFVKNEEREFSTNPKYLMLISYSLHLATFIEMKKCIVLFVVLSGKRIISYYVLNPVGKMYF